MEIKDTRYARAPDGAYIAYQVGGGHVLDEEDIRLARGLPLGTSALTYDFDSGRLGLEAEILSGSSY